MRGKEGAAGHPEQCGHGGTAIVGGEELAGAGGNGVLRPPNRPQRPSGGSGEKGASIPKLFAAME
jgi:hypothetical protein